ncbi:hypothetical protein C7459_10443 [Tumebacillus permanentifrigoris]|uniref:Uncharacterized protein n=1 Tax=Tumebacillus permanentifrigoris TaxID=378543 RepID=A0A316DF30_9BACL|nr:hypothetical protein C7459_10443 [Tumebacillus permanentifrigoris]
MAVASEVKSAHPTVGGEEIILYTQLAWHKDKWISPALQAFLDVTREKFHVSTGGKKRLRHAGGRVFFSLRVRSRGLEVALLELCGDLLDILANLAFRSSKASSEVCAGMAVALMTYQFTFKTFQLCEQRIGRYTGAVHLLRCFQRLQVVGVWLIAHSMTPFEMMDGGAI